MKKKILNILAVGLFLIGTVGAAHADLIEQDYLTPGDGLITYDTNTGLYWLDLTVTTNLSYNDVLNEISEGGSLEGFWYATRADIDTLQVSAGLPSGLFFDSFPIYLDYMHQLIDLVGLTDPSTVLSDGITSDPFEPTTTIDDRIVRYFTARRAAEAAQGIMGDDIASPSTGSWLITDTPPDIDNDGIPNYIDNCLDTPNPDQEDSDLDAVGDICDVCPDIADDQTDSDGDGWGDACDSCPTDPDKVNSGVCGCGMSDVDTDLDGSPDCIDQCPTDSNKVVAGECGCGTPDIDSDNDGTLDCNDQCPFDAAKTIPGACGCGSPDSDTDNDGFADCIDACIYDSLNDIDNDGICGDVDNCPGNYNADQLDFDGDGIGDICDQDADGDGYSVDNDCNDLDAAINPAQCDIKDDGIDQDCDGVDRINGKPCSADNGDVPITTEGKGQTCSDGIDNDGDGLTDCNDSDCLRNKSCK